MPLDGRASLYFGSTAQATAPWNVVSQPAQQSVGVHHAELGIKDDREKPPYVPSLEPAFKRE